VRNIVLGLTLILAAAVGALTTAPAHAGTARQPYGGCDEAHNFPHSLGAQDCRVLGWTIRARLVVGPRGYVHFASLPLCREEDGSGQRSACTWNFGPGPEGLYHPGQVTGNGIGLKYWMDEHDRQHIVKGWIR
jgi:hypothetical protein